MNSASSPPCILVIRFSSIGDLILLTPIFRELKKAIPSAQIDFLTAEDRREIFAGNPYIRKIYGFKKSVSEESCIKEITARRYDFVFDAHRNLRSTKFLAKIKQKTSIGKVIKVHKRYLSRYALLWFKKKLKKSETQIESYLNMILLAFPHAQIKKYTEVFPSPENFQVAESLLGAGKKTIAVNPCASFKTKKWSEAKFLELCIKLPVAYQIALIIENPGDISKIFLEECKKAGKDLKVLCGLEILTLAACLKKCALAISNDSMVTHLAEAVNTKVLCIFGGTLPEFGFAPFLKGSRCLVGSADCQPCHLQGRNFCKNKKSPYLCLESISSGKTLSLAQKMLISAP